MKKSIFSKITIKVQLMILCAIFIVCSACITTYALLASTNELEEKLISDRLVADINYIEDLIGEGDWNIRDGAIYLGDTLVGDGTEENANIAPFLEHQDKTGTFSYVFMLCSDENLGYVESTDTSEGYWQGHFIRVAGSTKSPEGKSIVGTYISKDVADILDQSGTYEGEANVAGGMIYCLYNTLTDADGQVIGAIVVGRNVSELKSIINDTIGKDIVLSLVVFLLLAAFAFGMTARETASFKAIADYINEIREGRLPEKPLQCRTVGETVLIVENINSMVDSMRRNEWLQVQAATDEITCISNRFGFDANVTAIFDQCKRDHTTFALEIFDVDYFKQYNDNYGHQMGDNVLAQIGQVLVKVSIEHGVAVARYGGDEFTIVYGDKTENDILVIMKEIKDTLRELDIPHEFSKAKPYVTVSQGAAIGIPGEHSDPAAFLKIADEALYNMKKQQRNAYLLVHVDEGI